MTFTHAKELILCVGLVFTAIVRVVEDSGDAHRRACGAVFLPVWSWLLIALGSVLLGLTGRVSVYAVEEGARWCLVLLFVAVNRDILGMLVWRWRILHAVGLSGASAGLLGIGQYFGWLSALFPVFSGYAQPMYSVFGNQDLLGGFLAISLPLLLWSLQGSRGARRAVFAAAAVCVVLALVLCGSRSGWLAGGVGCLFVVLRGASRPRQWLAGGLVAGALLGALVLTWPETSARVLGTFQEGDVGGRARLWFWDAAARMVWDHPVLGVGLGQYGYWSPWYQGAALAGRFGEGHYRNELHTDHAHSAPLDIISETGLVGAALFLWFALGVRLRRGVVRWALLAAFTFSLLNSTLHATGHLLVILMLVQVGARGRGSLGETRRRILGLPAAAAAVVLVAGYCGTVLLGSAHLRTAEAAHLRGQDAALPYLRALRHFWPGYQARESFAIYQLERGEASGAYVLLAEARKGLDTGRVHYLSAQAAALCGLPEEAAGHWEACYFRWPGRRPDSATGSGGGVPAAGR